MMYLHQAKLDWLRGTFLLLLIVLTGLYGRVTQPPFRHEYFVGRVYFVSSPYPAGADPSHWIRLFDADGGRVRYVPVFPSRR